MIQTIRCRKCGREVFHKTKLCPFCGDLISPQSLRTKPETSHTQSVPISYSVTGESSQYRVSIRQDYESTESKSRLNKVLTALESLDRLYSMWKVSERAYMELKNEYQEELLKLQQSELQRLQK